MSASPKQTPDQPATPFGDATPGVVDGRPQLREWIAENLVLAAHEAEAAWGAASIADDVGLKYHVSRMAAHARQAIDSTNDLKRVNDPNYGVESGAGS